MRAGEIDRHVLVVIRLNHDTLVISVSDRGPGLAPGDETKVFEKFYRAQRSGERSGVGLGLAICRGIVETHGGRIWADNRPGGGVAFRFTLPIQGTPPPSAPETEMTDAQHPVSS